MGWAIYNMKNIIESVLVTHLGKYIDGLKNSLDIGLLDGQVTIENVSLKASFVNELGLPFTLRFSHIEKIHISIPWTSLKEKSTVVKVQGIYVLLNISYTESEDAPDPAQLLRSMIQRIRLQMKKKWSQGGKEQGFAQKNLIRIVDNAVVSVNNIHIRLQSYHRNWDYSFGVIMDGITSYTVDENEQRTFYTRHFSHKEQNLPFKKLLNIDKLQLYFNDTEDVFICNHAHKPPHYLIRMMAHPFPNRAPATPKKPKPEQLQPYPTYSIKNLTTIRLSAVGSQRFAPDMRYVVDVNVVINSIDVALNSRQLSQVLHCAQHFYTYGLNIIKNGRKGYSFDENRQKTYRALVTKLAKEEKLTSLENSTLLGIVAEVPVSVLQAINDEVIQGVRFQKEMKKITQVRNAQKSKKMMQQLLQKKEKMQAMEGIEIFKEVLIDVKVYRLNLAIRDVQQITVAQFGMLGVSLNVHMDLTGQIKLTCDVKNAILMAGGMQTSVDHFDPVHSLLKIETVLMKNDVQSLQVRLLKKEIRVRQEVLCSILGWVSMVRLQPALLNFAAQLLNYSIDITRIMMDFLCAPKRTISLELALPLLRITLANNAVAVDMGRFVGSSGLNASEFVMEQASPMAVACNDLRLVQIQGCTVRMHSRNDKLQHQKITISLSSLLLPHPQELIRMAYQLKQGQILTYWQALAIADHSTDELLDGHFFLNKLKERLRAKIVLSELVFFSQERKDFPQQKISLTRTRVYRLAVQGRWFIVFKEQVDKQVNIVQAASEKAMRTLFFKLKDYIQEISTAFQWEKYYRQLYKEDITTLQQIQDANLTNRPLMALHVHAALLRLTLATDAVLAFKNLSTAITYNEFNTQGALGVGGLQLQVGEEAVISDTSLRGSYESLQSKVIVLQVSKLNYQVRLFSTFSRMIAITADYRLLAIALRPHTRTPPIAVQEDETRLANIKSQSSRADNINKFLLQFKLTLKVTHLDGEILQYRNRLSSISLQAWKNRNEPHPSVSADFKGILLFSMVQLPTLSVTFTPNEVTVVVDSINAEVDLQTIIYEVVRGEGSLILKEVVKTIRDSRIAKDKKELQAGNAVNVPAGVRRVLNGRLGQLRVQLKVTRQLSLGVSSRSLQTVGGRFSWSDTLFWLNGECISLVQNNGILKWTPSQADLCMTNFKLKLNSREILFLIYQLNKIKKFFRINKFDPIAFVQQEFSNPDEQGRVAQPSNIAFSIRIEQLQLVYECGDRNPLLSVRLCPLFLTTQGEANSINVAVWHLNRHLKLYEPVVEPLLVRLLQKSDNRQLEISVEDAYVIVSQECLADCLGQAKILKQVQEQLQADESVQLQQMGPEQVSHEKQGMAERVFQWYVSPNFQHKVEHSFMLRVGNLLGAAAIVQVCCGKKGKQRMVFQAEQAETRALHIPQRTSYHHSYQLIERYEKVQLKLCIMSPFYSARATSVSFLLYDRDNHYIRGVTFIDGNGVEIQSRVAVKVGYAEGGYQIDLVGKYGIQSQLPLPLHFRYADACSINKRTLLRGQQLLLPPWTVDYVTFGLHPDQYNHILRLRPQSGEQTEGCFILSVPYTETSKVQLIIQKVAISEKAKQTPKLKYLKHPDQTGKEKQVQKEEKDKDDKEKKQEKKDEPLSIYVFKILPGVFLLNHLNFPITVNQIAYQPKQPKELLQIYHENGRQFLRLSLGDRSTHEIYIPATNQPTALSLKLTEDNYVSIFLQVRKNMLQQRMIHLYAEVQLIINVHTLHPPTLITNIYQHRFVVKKQVKNGYTDRPHPAPIVKDKFCFNTAHYLLSMEEKYMLLKLNNCTSNEFILFHSDFDTDLKLTSDQNAEVEAVFAVSYNCETVILESDEEGRKPELLECFTTHIMPKYYIINRSEESFVVNGSLLIRPGQKITISNTKYLDLNVRDQIDYKYMAAPIDNATYLLFVRGTEPEQSITNKAEVDPNERVAEVNGRFELHLMTTVCEVTERASTARLQSEIQVSGSERGLPVVTEFNHEATQINEEQQADVSLQCGAKHILSMQDIQIFAVSRRPCSYNTVCYEINGWTEWLSVTNKLSHVLILRIRLQEGIVGVERIAPGSSGRIIAAISPCVEFALKLKDEQGIQHETILGQYELDQRLNHTIFVNQSGYSEIALRETKVRVGRLVTVQDIVDGQEQNIHKVQQSVKVRIGRIRVSLVFSQERVRRELIRVSLVGLSLLAMRYRNGLYMLHLQLQSLNGIYKRVSFLLLQSLSGYLQGVQGEFVERVAIDLGPLVEITLTDQFIVSLIAQAQALQQLLPPGTKGEEASLQQQQTYHINSIAVKPIQIKLCMRKRISEMTQQKSKLLSKVGLSFVQVEDALIHLSPVDITTPLRQKHINGISKMYGMESFVGVASGLNILGNPAQFVSQFEAGRNRGGAGPFFRSIVAGTSNSLSKIIGTIGSGVSQLTFDRQFKKHRIDNKNIKAESFGMGLKIGLRELGHSLKSGFVGVVQQPIQGHRQEGGVGVLKGMLAGLTGLVTKPLTGIIFAASKTIQGVNSSVTFLDYRRWQREELITRPLYHRFRLVRPYRPEDELAYNILLNWWEYSQVELVGAYLLQNEEGDSVVDILIITCSELILIDLDSKEVRLKLRTEQLMATGKFTEGVVLYYQDGSSEQDQDQIVFRLQNDPNARDNLYWTLKGFIGLYAQKEQ